MNYQVILDGDIGGWGYSKGWLRSVLDQHKGKHVDMRISSYGGDLAHGLDMRQQLIDHGDVTVYFTGFSASAATIVAMGASKIRMSKYALILVHKCSNFVDAWGYLNADEMQALINQLEDNKKENDKIDVMIAKLYSERCGKAVGDILDILKRGAWLTAQEALELGLIDEIVEDAGDTKVDCTDELRAKLCAYHLPTDWARTATEPQVTHETDTSLLDKILATLKSLVSKSQTQQPSNNPMETSQQPINAQPVVNAPDIRDEKIAKLQQEVDELREQVRNLRNAPGAETQGIVDDQGEQSMTADQVYNFINEIL